MVGLFALTTWQQGRKKLLSGSTDRRIWCEWPWLHVYHGTTEMKVLLVSKAKRRRLVDGMPVFWSENLKSIMLWFEQCFLCLACRLFILFSMHVHMCTDDGNSTNIERKWGHWGFSNHCANAIARMSGCCFIPKVELWAMLETRYNAGCLSDVVWRHDVK